MLIRSSLEDPEPSVQNAAQSALDTLIGSEAKPAVAAYRSAPANDPWLLVDVQDAGEDESADDEWEELSGKDLLDYLETGEEEESDETEDLEDVPEGEPEDEHSLHGLITALQTSRDPDLRQRALQLLARSRNINAIWYLAQTALYSEDEELKTAAQSILQERFGDHTGSILQGYREGNLEQDLELDEDEAEGEDEEDELPEAESPYQQTPSLQDSKLPQVIQEDTLNWRLIIVAGLAVLGVVVIILLVTIGV